MSRAGSGTKWGVHFMFRVSVIHYSRDVSFTFCGQRRRNGHTPNTPENDQVLSFDNRQTVKSAHRFARITY